MSPTVPLPPHTPTIVRRANGLIQIKFSPLLGNPNGPISGYRVVVINETDGVAFNQMTLYDYERAKSEGLGYWVAAEISPDWFDLQSTFAVGDGRRYGEYYNFGPLPSDQDFHVTAGTVSTLNNKTKGM